MKQLAKRTLSLLLAVLMVLSLVPASPHAHAADAQSLAEGYEHSGLGDVNSDGKVNLVDAILTIQDLNGIDVDIDRNAADINCDGELNQNDIETILHLANYHDCAAAGCTESMTGATYQLGGARAKVNEVVSIEFTTENNPGLTGYKASLNYDETTLRLVYVTVSAGTSDLNHNSLAVMSANPITNSTLFTAEFEILDGAKDGETYAVTATV